jgi:hypothetical protein
MRRDDAEETMLGDEAEETKRRERCGGNDAEGTMLDDEGDGRRGRRASQVREPRVQATLRRHATEPRVSARDGTMREQREHAKRGCQDMACAQATRACHVAVPHASARDGSTRGRQETSHVRMPYHGTTARCHACAPGEKL